MALINPVVNLKARSGIFDLMLALIKANKNENTS